MDLRGMDGVGRVFGPQKMDRPTQLVVVWGVWYGGVVECVKG